VSGASGADVHCRLPPELVDRDDFVEQVVANKHILLGDSQTRMALVMMTSSSPDNNSRIYKERSIACKQLLKTLITTWQTNRRRLKYEQR